MAAELGAGAVSGLIYGTVGKMTGRAATRREIDGVCRFLERAARLAKSFSLKIGIKPCNRYETHLINRARDAARIIERVGAENISIHLETFHMLVEEQSFAAGFDAAAPFLGYVNLSESHRGVPGQGILDWASVMKAIAGIGYKGALTLQAVNHADSDLADGLAAWRPASERPDDVIELGLPLLRDEAKKAGITLG